MTYCPLCQAIPGSRYVHWIEFESAQKLRDHFEQQGYGSIKYGGILDWWHTIQDSYRSCASPITGAPLSVREAWMDAQIKARREHCTVTDERSAAKIREEFWEQNDPRMTDDQLRKSVMAQIMALLNEFGMRGEEMRHA